MSIRVEQDGRLRRITMAAIEKKNSLDAVLCQDLLVQLRDAAADETVGARRHVAATLRAAHYDVRNGTHAGVGPMTMSGVVGARTVHGESP